MNTFFYIFLFIFGTLFGSFASVLIYRIRSGETWIWTGRSHCKTCDRYLSALELVPIFSWLFQGGKCKGCKQKISAIYPVLEITTGILFSFVWIFLISSDLIVAWNILEWSKLLFFCSLMFLTVIYVFYDILYLEIPESVLIAANISSVWILILQGLGYGFIPYLTLWWLDLSTLLICLSILWVLYYILFAELKEIYDCLLIIWCIIALTSYIHYTTLTHTSSALLSGTIAALAIYISFFLQIILSGWRAMWAGDLRIAILMGLLVWSSFAFSAWIICYFIGSMIGIYILLQAKLKEWWKTKLTHQIPFGPFIASGYLIVLFFFPQISNFLEWYLP